MQDRAKRILLGCAAGCGVLVVLGIGSCVAFTSWLRAPGEILEAEQMLDRDAVGYAEWRLDLDDPGTQLMVDAAITAMNRQGEAVELPSVLRFLMGINNRRQARKLKDLFPATVVWSLYPEDGDLGASLEGRAADEGISEDSAVDVNLFSVSVARLAHQLVLAEWVMGWFLPWAPSDFPVTEYRGENILAVEDESPSEDDPAKDRSALYAFLDPRGIFFADDLEGAKKAVDRLAGSEIVVGEEGGPTRLERLYAGLDPGRPLRGALTNQRGELVRLFRRLEGGAAAGEEQPLEVSVEEEPFEEGSKRASVDPGLEAALAGVDALVWSGGPLADGDLVLDLVFFATPGVAEQLEAPIRNTVSELQEAWLDREAPIETPLDTPLEAEVARTDQGVTVSLRLPDLAKRIEEWTIGGSWSGSRRGRWSVEVEDSPER